METALDSSQGRALGSTVVSAMQDPSTRKTKRSAIACKRCRRLRTKCVQENFKVPCLPCQQAGNLEANTCAFPNRGNDEDRKYRARRAEEQAADTFQQDSSSDPINQALRLAPVPQSMKSYSNSDVWKLLPPRQELLAGVEIFTRTCLQVGFIPKALFLEKLANNQYSVNVFLLVSMLSISARFTPELRNRFGDSKEAAQFFMDIANTMIPREMYKTTLENTQSFFLLGMAEWGKGDRDRSTVCQQLQVYAYGSANVQQINMGIAVRMAGVLRLHREETYNTEARNSSDAQVDAESARRTFWCIQNHDNLYTQQNLPLSYAKSDITALLPGNENDFAFGRVTKSRSALAGTAAADRRPDLVKLQSQSLFATLIQAHDLWGTIARQTYRGKLAADGTDLPPWDNNGRFQNACRLLRSWEQNVPDEFKWSKWNLRGFKAEHVELAYLSIVTITRLNNVILRRHYLKNIVAQILEGQDAADDSPPGFWQSVSYELFSNVWELYDAIDSSFNLRAQDDGFPAMLAFCTYTCGSLASYLVKWPQICPQLCSNSDSIVRRSLQILQMFASKWPAVADWIATLRQVSQSMAGGQSELSTEISTQEALLNDAVSLGTSPHAQRQAVDAEPMHDHIHNSQEPSASPVNSFEAPIYNTLPTTIDTAEEMRFGNGNNLHLLSTAASFDSYRYSQFANRSDVYLPRRKQAAITQPSGPAPEPAEVDFLASAFDNDLADFIEGYAPLGWEGWEI